MKKVLLVLLVVLLVLSVPPLRAFASPVIDPLGEKLALIIAPAVNAVREPFMVWKARDEARAIVVLLRDQEAIGQPLPRMRDFPEFIQRRYRANREGLDPWGIPYYLRYTDEGAVVGSAGPDMLVDTPDDIREILPRRLR